MKVYGNTYDPIITRYKCRFCDCCSTNSVDNTIHKKEIFEAFRSCCINIHDFRSVYYDQTSRTYHMWIDICGVCWEIIEMHELDIKKIFVINSHDYSITEQVKQDILHQVGYDLYYILLRRIIPIKIDGNIIQKIMEYVVPICTWPVVKGVRKSKHFQIRRCVIL